MGVGLHGLFEGVVILLKRIQGSLKFLELYAVRTGVVGEFYGVGDGGLDFELPPGGLVDDVSGSDLFDMVVVRALYFDVVTPACDDRVGRPVNHTVFHAPNLNVGVPVNRKVVILSNRFGLIEGDGRGKPCFVCARSLATNSLKVGSFDFEVPRTKITLWVLLSG
jgi:hypothetical protein